jgi:ribosomal-protein-alanine N-acetyltransferase
VTAHWKVRWIAPQDVPAVLEIQSGTPQAAQWPEQDYRAACDHLLMAVVAQAGRRVGGFLLGRVTFDEMEILNLAVAQDERRKGIGTLLMDAALQIALACQAQRVFLEVRESNASAVAFYRRCGFRLAGRRPRSYSSPVEDALLMTRELAVNQR